MPRHASLIALSQDHHHALALALRCRKQALGRIKPMGQEGLKERAKEVQGFFSSGLRKHFQAEEEILFPFMQGSIAESQTLIASLIQDHRKLRDCADGMDKQTNLAKILFDFGDLLEGHIRREERELFPLFEKHIGREEAERVKNEIQRILDRASGIDFGGCMMKFKEQISGKDIDFTPQRVLIAGYTGRNQAEVRAHIEELAAQGIPGPSEIPTIFRTTLDRLTTGRELEVLGEKSSGEAEAVLLTDHEKLWVAVGSDHTDRQLERVDIQASKQVCPKPISLEVWNYADVRDRWDDLVLRSWVGEAGREELYQEGRMSAVLRPEALLATLRGRVGASLDRSVIYTGTIPLRGGVFLTRPYFEAELFDEDTGRSLRCAYRAHPVDAL